MRVRSTKLTATAVGALLGYGAASADLFRNAVAAGTTKQTARLLAHLHRHGCTPHTGMSHMGFRCVLTPEKRGKSAQ